VEYLATAAEIDGITGQYFSGMKQTRAAELKGSVELGGRLWQLSEQWTGV
jgi:hypothetical protein